MSEDTTLYKIKLVFPITELKGSTSEQALAHVAPAIGHPKYVEKYNDKLEYFHFKIPGPEGFKTEAHTWALEKTSLDKDWGLVYRFTHDLAGVNFAVPFPEIALKVLEGNLLLRKMESGFCFPILLAYPLPEMDDEPVLSELKTWGETQRSQTRQLLAQARNFLKSFRTQEEVKGVDA